MTAQDNFVLTGPYNIPLGTNAAGVLAIANLNLGIGITITINGDTIPSEIVRLSQAGATLNVPLKGVRSVTVEADSYPATILYLNTLNSDLLLTTPQSFAGASGGGATVNVEPVGYAGAVKTTVVTVGTTPTLLPAAALANRRNLSLQVPADAGQTIYVGGSTVTADETATGGLQIAAGGSFSDTLGAALIYAIVKAGTAPIIVYEAS